MDYNQKKIEGTSEGNQDQDIENIGNTSDEKLDKFKEIGARRVAAACKAIQLIGNLSNKGAYHYEKKHLQQIFDALDKEVAEMKAKFQPAKEEKNSFSFNE
jgi:cell division protein ZapA (FtsZ GTPase activity inhibitor)